MRQRHFVFLIVMVTIAANALGYVLFRARRPAPAPSPPPSAPHREAPAPKSPEDAEREARGRVLREAGYQALLEGDYDKALIQLTEARSNLAEKSSVDDLLRVTEQLRAKAQAQTRGASPEERADVDAKENQRPAKGKPARRATPTRGPEREVIHSEAVPTESPRGAKVEPVTTTTGPPATPMGLLLVTSTPRGLLVHVDGVAMDLTPMRSSVSAGAHRVALYDGDRKLFETLVEVTESQPTTVVKDLTFELTPPPVATVAPVRGPPPEPAPPAPAQQPTVATPVAPASSSGSGRGGLEITSPGLYAEVWVNGRPYGFPPARVEDLPAGSADVEIRINGVVKRAKTVNVEAGKVTAVKITR